MLRTGTIIVSQNSFSYPVSVEVTNGTKRKPNEATPTHMKTKVLFGPRVSENWLRIMVLQKHLHRTETNETHGREAPDENT